MDLLEQYNTYGSLWSAVLFLSVIVIVSKANSVRWSFKTCPSQTLVLIVVATSVYFVPLRILLNVRLSAS